MKKLRWQLLIIFLTGLVVGILLLGEQPKPISTVASPEPVKGGVYTEALVGSLLRLNPLLSIYNPADQDVSRLIFNGLLRFDSTGGPQADLAETYGFSQDGTCITSPCEKMPGGMMASQLLPMMWSTPSSCCARAQASFHRMCRTFGKKWKW
jgi:hypothetical protein